MQEERFTVTEWVEMFEAVGLDERKRHAWHAEFERRFPTAHARFLAWLGVKAEEIEKIRALSRADWAR